MADRRSSNSSSESEKELANQIEQLRKDVSAISQSLKDIGAAKVDELTDDAKSRVSEFADIGRRQMKDLSRGARNLEADVAAHVRDKPLQSLVVAAMIGLLLGLITRRG